MAFAKATKRQSKLRMALFGPSGSGKTMTALKVASVFGKVAVIDTERGSASKYADLFEFDVLELSTYSPNDFMNAIREADKAGYDVLVIDSLSHAWSGSGGVLELVDRAAKRSQSNNSFTAWRDVTPLHNQLVDTILTARLHVIVTMRSKTEYVLETNDKGKQQPRKVGLAPVQRDGMEYEFDVVAEMDMDNTLLVSKTRCVALNGAAIPQPGATLGETLLTWLSDGAPALPTPEQPQPQTQGATTQPPQAQPSNVIDLDATFPRNPPIKAWTDAEIKLFVKQYRDATITDGEVLRALEVSGLREWKGTLEQAHIALDAYIAAQMGVALVTP